MGTQPPTNPQNVNPQMHGSAPPIAPMAAKKGLGPLGWILVTLGALFAVFVVVILAGGLFIMHKVKQSGLDPDLMKRNPALAVTKLISTVNPNTEVLGVDESRGIIHVRDKQTGKTFTMNFEDAKHGRMVFQEDGKDAVTVTATGDGQKAHVVVQSKGKDALTLNASADEKNGRVDIRTSDGTATFGTGAANAPSWLPAYPGSQPEGLVGAATRDTTSGSFHFLTNDGIEKVASFYKAALKSAGLKIDSITSSEASGKVGGGLVAADTAKQRNVMIGYALENGKTNVTVGFSEKK